MMLNRTLIGLSAAVSLMMLCGGLTGCLGVCTQVGCDDSLRGEGAIAVASGERAELEIEACRNDVCSQGVIDSDTFGSNDSGGVTLSGDADVTCSLQRSQSAAFWEMRVSFRPDDGAGDFDDGDVMRLRVVDMQSGETIVDLQQTINFGTFSPNGSSCGPNCQVQSFEIPNAANTGA